MITSYQDFTIPFNQNEEIVIDTSEWDYVIAQFVNPSGTISIQTSNDGGAVFGVSDGSAANSTNYTAVQATLLTAGSTVTTVAAAGLYKVIVVGQYLRFGGASAAADKVLVRLSKIC